MIAAARPRPFVRRQYIVDIIKAACRHHALKLDRDMLQLAWAHKAAWEIEQSGVQGDLLISAIQVHIERRHVELQAARWYAVN